MWRNKNWPKQQNKCCSNKCQNSVDLQEWMFENPQGMIDKICTRDYSYCVRHGWDVLEILRILSVWRETLMWLKIIVGLLPMTTKDQTRTPSVLFLPVQQTGHQGSWIVPSPSFTSHTGIIDYIIGTTSQHFLYLVVLAMGQLSQLRNFQWIVMKICINL